MEKKKKIIVSILLLILILTVGFAACYKIYVHEKYQGTELTNLLSEVEQLNNRITVLEEKENSRELSGSIVWPEDTYNYLAIGNSITYHEICDYWWSESGMAATTVDKDFVHILEDHLKKVNGKVTANICSLIVWETQAHDRAELLCMLDPYLDENIDLVTIQLGENVWDITDFETDFTYLIEYVKSAAPDAEIIVVGDIWESGNRDDIKKVVSTNCNVKYVNLDEIKDNKDYQSELGATLYGDDGAEHIIEHFGVALHPSDKGMEYIANAIIDSLEER